MDKSQLLRQIFIPGPSAFTIPVRGHMIPASEGLVEIARAPVAKHRRNLLDGKRGPAQQNLRTLHPLLENDLRELLSRFLVQHRRYVIRMIRKTFRDLLEGDRIRVICDIFENPAYGRIRIDLRPLFFKFSRDEGKQRLSHRQQDILGILSAVCVFDNHHLQQRPELPVLSEGKVEERIGETILLRIQIETEQRAVGGEGLHKLPEKRVLPDEHASDRRFCSGLGPERVAAEGLADVAFVLANLNQIVCILAERCVISPISIIKKEKILTVKGFVDIRSPVYADDDILVPGTREKLFL